MGAQIVKVNMALGAEHDLINPTSTRNYPLGYEIQVENSDLTMISKYIYVYAHTTLTAYQPYELKGSATAGREVCTAATSVAAGAPGAIIVVPQVAFTSGYYGFVLLEGYGQGNTTETLTAGDFLQVATSGTTFILDGTAGSSPFTANTCAMALENGTTGSTTALKIMLLRGKAVITT